MKYFYWYRSMIGRWSPCINSVYPTKGPDKPKPKLAFEPIKLEGELENLTLQECMARWPAPPEEPQMVPATPPEPNPPQSPEIQAEPEKKDEQPDQQQSDEFAFFRH